MYKPPCYQCTERYASCHSECKQYALWAKANKEQREELARIRCENYMLYNDIKMRAKRGRKK